MCNHYQQPDLQLMQHYLKENLNLPLASQESSQFSYAKMHDVFPKKDALLLLKSSTGKLGFMQKKWGYPNPFDTKKILFNARIEKMQNYNSMWQDSFLNRRCIIIAKQFFETGPNTYLAPNGKKYKETFSFKNQNSPLTFIAGIYEQDHFAMITTQSTPSYAQIHERMPLVLNEHNLNTWFRYDISSILNDTSLSLEKNLITNCKINSRFYNQ